MSKFYERYSELCAKKDVSLSRAAQDIGLSNAAASGWAEGKAPRLTTLKKLSAYFGVTVEYLKGEEEQKENPGIPKDTEVDPIKAELLNLIEGATAAERKDYLDILRVYVSRHEKR